MPPGDRISSVQRSLNRVLAERVDILGKQRAAEENVTKATDSAIDSQTQLGESYKNVAKKAEGAIQSQRKYADQIAKTTKVQTTFARVAREAAGYFKDQAATLSRDWLPLLTFGALSMRAMTLATAATTSATKKYIAQSRRLDGVTTSYKAIVDRGKQVVKVNQDNVRISYQYGKSVEYVTNVSDKWLATMRISDITDANRTSLTKLTKTTLLFADAMGVDAVELQEKAANRMHRFGETAEEAVTGLANVHFQVLAVNEELANGVGGNGAHMWAEDFTALVEKAAQETRSYAQDLDTLTAAMMYSAKEAAKTGATYTQQLDSAAAFGRFVNGDGLDDAFKVRVGESQLKQLMSNPEQFMAQFDQETQNQLKIIMGRKARGQADIFVVKALQETLATTEQGMTSLISEMMRGGGGDTMHLLTGMGEADAALVSDALASGESPAAIARGIMSSRDAARAEAAKSTEADKIRLTRALGGKDMLTGALTGMDPMAMVDQGLGEVAAQGEDPRVMGGLAAGAGAFGLMSWLLSKKKGDRDVDQAALEQAMGGGAMDTVGGVMGGGMGAMDPLEAALTRALSHFADGDSIRVVPTKSGMGSGNQPVISNFGDKWWDLTSSLTKMAAPSMIKAMTSGGGAGAGAAKGGMSAGTKLMAGGAVAGGGGLLAAGLAGAGSMAGAAGLAGMAAFESPSGKVYDSPTMRSINALWERNNREPIEPGAVDSDLLANMAGDIESAGTLMAHGYISPSLFAKIQDHYVNKIAPALPAPGAAPAPPSGGGGTGAVTSLKDKARNLFANVTGIDTATGDITLTILNGMAIPAHYDAMKATTR